MSEAMENVGAAANVAIGVKKSDYEEFVKKLDAILCDTDPRCRAMETREYYQGELDFMNEFL